MYDRNPIFPKNMLESNEMDRPIGFSFDKADSLRTLLILCDPDGCVIDANQASLNSLGLTRETLLKRPLWTLPWWNDHPEQITYLHEFVRSRLKNEIHLEQRGLDDKSRSFILSIQPDGNFLGEGQEIVHEHSPHSIRQNLTPLTAHLQALKDCLSDPIFFKDTMGFYLSCNKAFAATLGRTELDIIGKTDFDLLDQKTASFFHQGDLRALKTGQPERHERCITSPDGHKMFIETVKTRVETADGQPLGVVGVSRDITERIMTHERLRILSQAVEQSPVAIVITDPEGEVEFVNPRFCQNTGFESSEIVGHTPRLLCGKDAILEDQEVLWKEMRERRSSWSAQFANCRKDGSIFWEETAVSPVYDTADQIIHFVIIKRDITEQRNHEESMRQAVEHMTETNTQLERFTYLASHDLQEPLRTIVNFSQLLCRHSNGNLDDEEKEFLDFIVEAASHMRALISDLLSYARLAHEDRPFVPTSAEAACEAAMHNLRGSIMESHASIEIGSLPIVSADKIQLMQLFQNLLSNALKFHRPEVTPRVFITAVEETDHWIFSVTDNGIGIEDTAQDIFEAFRRLHPRNIYPGTGIGLANCRRIVERHGGRIWMESQVGKGTTFRFTLPKIPPVQG